MGSHDGLPQEDSCIWVESPREHSGEYINAHEDALALRQKHQEGGVVLLTPEPNRIIAVATILMQMTTVRAS